ncbi:hypothetical protein BGX38DRAFT_708088 [Terfezia claveryi]|nr:hypothetical protein BGX38DRAFT_708088 [Terfezia claveryi]
MSSSAFCSALGKALARCPLSPLAVARLNSTFTTVQQQQTSEAGKPPHHTPLAPPKQPSSRTVNEPGCPTRPSPLSTRHGRKIPKLLLTLRDLKLAQDIPGPARGKRNLVHTDPKAPKKRALRRQEDREWASKHGKPAKKHPRVLPYHEQVRRYKLELARFDLIPVMKEGATFSRRKGKRCEKLSLSSITREYMEAVAWFTKCSFSPFYKGSWGPRIYTGLDPDIVVITKTFTYKNRWFLQSKGYDPWDVVVWGWILVAKDAEQAGWRMKIYQDGLPKRKPKEIEKVATKLQVAVDDMSSRSEARLSIDTDPTEAPTLKCDDPEPPVPKGISPIAPPKPFPSFLILHTIRRKPLSRTTLNYIIAGGSTFLSQLGSDYKSKTLFIVRLLRRIQEENILALPYLVQLIVTHLELTPNTSVQHLTFLYNRLLSLIARPSHERPFQYHPLIQQSQFMLLRQMSAINILITREGYRAIISVQLARAKTTEERERIKGMKMSWPPWQEERDAWSDKLDRGRVTRAGVVLRQMKEAGYAMKGWDSAAAILAGEDTDRTPTIATRTYLRLPPSSTIAKGKEKFERGSKAKQVPVAGERISSMTGNKKLETQRPASHHGRGEELVWRARIRATRTLEEAWAIFLDARNNLNPTGGMYQELSEKVIAAERLHREKEEEKRKFNIPVPGEETGEGSNRDPSPSEDPSTMEFLLSLPKWLTPEQRLMLLRNHANELRMKQLQEEKYRPGNPVPGEGKEVLPAPFSPSEGGVHLPITPPTLTSLYHMMHQDNFQPTQEMLILLVKKARDMETADRLLGKELVHEIWSGYDPLSSNRKLKRPNWRLLTAYLQALINSGFIQRAVRLLIITSMRKDSLTWRYLPAWNVTMKALVDWKFRAYPISWKRTRALVESNVEQRKSWLYLVWKLYVHMRDLKIDIDGQTMMILCTAARKAMQLEEDVRKGRGDREVEEILWDGRKPWEQVVDVFRKLVGNVQSTAERDTEIRALREKAMDFNKWDGGREAAKEEEKPEPVPFWAEFDEAKDEPMIVPAALTELSNHPQLDASIDPDYYTPYPPPPPPPPARIPEPDNSAAVIASRYSPPLYVPNFAVLHTYIRALGFAGQKKEVISTLSWMARLARGEGNSGGISLPLKGTSEVGTTEGEKRRVRTCIIAVRTWGGEIVGRLAVG